MTEALLATMQSAEGDPHSSPLLAVAEAEAKPHTPGAEAAGPTVDVDDATEWAAPSVAGGVRKSEI